MKQNKNSRHPSSGGKSTTVFKIHGLNRKPYGKRALIAAAKHNKREITDPLGRHEPGRAHLNQSLFGLPGTADGVVALATCTMEARGYKPKRHDATIAAEGVFSLAEVPASFDMAAYFGDCARWLEGSLGGLLLSADIHLDEDHPHCHAIVLLPLAGEAGGQSGSDIVGYKQATRDRKQALQRQVADRYGLRVVAVDLSAEQRKVLARDVHSELRAAQDPILASPLFPWVARCIDRDPVGAAQELGVGIRAAHSLPVLAQSAGSGSRLAHHA